jgi:mannitol-1-/sugar-/sorbitol-6-phosphatase
MQSFVCQGVLFDLDGVLVDSTECAGRIWKKWALERGLDPELMVRSAHGRPTIETVRMMAPQLDAEHEARIIEEREVTEVDGLKAVPGAKELLAKLPPERWTIVTSGSRRLATARLRAAGLPIPEKMITADDIINGKPDPEPYLKGARLLGFKPENCMVFEDSPPGIRAAKSAGATIVSFPTTYPVDTLSEADFVTDSFRSVKVEMLASGELQLEVQSLQPCACPS